MFYDEVDDVLAAARFLANQLGVDPTQLFLAGHSVGGTTALLAAMNLLDRTGDFVETSLRRLIRQPGVRSCV
jgi:acetyl esterase/lipase